MLTMLPTPCRGVALACVVAAALVAMLSGCSSFERKWQAAAETPDPDDQITGRWVGQWRSDHNDHTGELRAIVEANDDGTFDILYHATYGTWLTFTYSYALENMRTEQRDGVHHFAGESDLGWFGSYSHNGLATPTQFVADYEASIGDYGSYRLQRPE